MLYIFFTDINECSSNPCLNGGSCTDKINGYTCSCQPGYTGAQCQTSEKYSQCNIPTIVLAKLVINLLILPRKVVFSHILHFVTDINECSSNPCLNGGSCTDKINGYTCSCQPGYTGAQCQTSEKYSQCNIPTIVLAKLVINLLILPRKVVFSHILHFVTDINECSSNPCLNGGSCTDKINGYTCSCQPGYTGARCQSGTYALALKTLQMLLFDIQEKIFRMKMTEIIR